MRTYRTESRYEIYVLFVFGGGQCEPYSCTYLRTEWKTRVRGGSNVTCDAPARSRGDLGAISAHGEEADITPFNRLKGENRLRPVTTCNDESPRAGHHGAAWGMMSSMPVREAGGVRPV